MKLNKLIFTAAAVLAIAVQPLYAVVAGQTAHAAGEIVNITTSAELRTAIESQDDNQTWNIQPGNYAVTQTNVISAGGQTNWYFPIVKNNITINGIGNPTIYGSGYTANGNWDTQDLVAVFGNNVTINGLTLMPKVEPNKTLEVLGSDFTLTNTVFAPNTMTDPSEYNNVNDPTDPTWQQASKEWGGSLYFNHAGNHTISNVTIYNAGISYRYSPAGTHIAFSNVKLVDSTNVDWINGYRYSAGFNDASNTISGSVGVEYHVSAALNNLASVLANLHAGDTIVLDSDISTSEQITISKPGVVFDGNGHNIKADFPKTGNDSNSAIGVHSDDVTVKNVKLDGVNPTVNKLHGVNVYGVKNVLVDGVTATNFRTGILYNSSTGTIQNVTTSDNEWHGINIDAKIPGVGSNVSILGTNSLSEPLNIYVDDTTKDITVYAPAYEYSHPGVIDSDTGLPRPNDRVYTLKAVITPETPTTPVVLAPGLPVTPIDRSGVEVAVADADAGSDNADADVKSATEVKGANDDTTGVSSTSTAAKSDDKHWSLVNVILAVVVAAQAVVALAAVRSSKDRERIARLLTLVPLAVAAIVLLTVEDFSAKLGMVDAWTLLFVVAVLAQTTLLAQVKKSSK